MNIQNAADHLFKRLDCLESGTLTLTTPDGKTRSFGGKAAGEQVALELKDWRVISRFLTKGNIGLAEDYRAGTGRPMI